MSEGALSGSRPGGSPPAATMEADATDEDRRVMALASDLRISSAISPHDLISLRTTTPLESDDGLDDDDENDDRREGKEDEPEHEDPSRRGEPAFFLRRCAAAAALSVCMILETKTRKMARKIFDSEG